MKLDLKYRHVLPRRTFLRSAAGALIGMPMLDEMRRNSAFGAPEPVPARFVTVFFAHGVTGRWFQTHYGAGPRLAPDPLLPLDGLRSKLGIYSGLHQTESGTHAQSGVQCFTGIAGRGSTSSIRAQGASIDQVVLKNGYAGGRSPSPIQTLAAATYFNTRNYSNERHTWREDGQVAAEPYSEVDVLFKAVMGLAPAPKPPMGSAPVDNKKQIYAKSVLDTAMEEYKHWTSDAAGLSSSSRARLRDHLEEVRSLELRIGQLQADGGGTSAACTLSAPQVTTSRRALEKEGAGSNDRVVDAVMWEKVWQAMADTYAMALSCDIARFGNITFQGAGDHVRFKTAWKYKDQTINFADNGESNHLSYYHNVANDENSSANIGARMHSLYMLAQVEYFLSRLDRIQAENGKTYLEANPVMVSSELGDGGGGHSTRNVLHVISGANGRFKTGQPFMFDTHASNFYNAVLQGLGVNQFMGFSKDAAQRDKVLGQIKA
ncbi:MAG: DUF1552 domain-containing protein [Deltaproteobacteria bacterium]|nr:DUF1552 domain-containing protein [Deltaproteobacteria bacterium]